MIQETMTHVCRVCESTHIVKNGTNRYGNAQYHCKDCGTYRVFMPKQAYAETEHHTVLRSCVEWHASLPWRAKSWGLPLASEAKPPASICGRAFQMTTSTATPSVIFVMPTNMCSRLKPIMVLGMKPGRLRIWNAGTTPCVNEWAATFGKRCPFQI